MVLTTDTEMTVMLANDIVDIFLEPECICIPANEIVKVMRSAVTTMLCSNKLTFDIATKYISVSPWKVDKTLPIVIDDIFEDGIINWGRIITLYTLVASLSIACKEKHIQYRAEDIATLVTDYVNKDKIHSWIMQNGGWNGFKSSFPLDRKVNRLLNNAYWVIGSIGIIGFVFYIYKKIY